MSNDFEDIMSDAAGEFLSSFAGSVGRNLADRAFQAQKEDEQFVEINPDGTVKPINPTAPPKQKGVRLRDPNGEY